MTGPATTCELKLKKMDLSLSSLRIIRPIQLERMQESLKRFGQLNPIILRRQEAHYQILDGFKRFYSAERLGWEHLQAMILDIPITQGKAMMLNYNKVSRSLLDYDEALVVHSLSREHMLDQVMISNLTGYSRSWVCRRLGMIDKLSESVQQHLRMGVISNTHARFIVRLPRGNQEIITRIIIDNNISSRDSQVLIDKFLASSTLKQQQYVISHPMEVIQMALEGNEIHDSRLSQHGNRLLKSIELLLIQNNIFTGQFTHYQSNKLKAKELGILSGRLERLEKSTGRILSILEKNKTRI
uniref:ParB/RepB/Spo0J family partition protein n=1 Tax=Candidatus Electrothrix sp. TaxID=2170559 RepID=UPI00405783AF